jgi:hypothetical protein
MRSPLFTENGVMIDLEEVSKVVDNCDVFTIGFRLIPERFMIDTRHNDADGPMLEIVEPVATVEERFFWLGQRRPSFGVPERFTFFIWPHSVTYLEDSGLMDRIRHRVYPIDADGGKQLARVIWKLHQLEGNAVRDAITGKNHHTIWEASSSAA